MTERNDRLNGMVASLASVQDEDLAPLSTTPAAQALFEEIVSTPRSKQPGLASRSGRFGPVRVGVAAAGVILVVLGLVTGPQLLRAPEAVAFTTEGDYTVARIADPEATKREVEDAFAERGLDVRAILVPASPSLVGIIGAMYPMGPTGPSGIGILFEEGACFTPGGGFQCPVGVKVPTDFVGLMTIEIGRPARAGEKYELATEAFAPGEALHCSGVRGKTVTEALPVLADRGLNVIWRTFGPGDDAQGTEPATIADHYLVDSVANAEGEVEIWVTRQRPNFNPEVAAMLDRGC